MDIDINKILWFYDCRRELDKSHFTNYNHISQVPMSLGILLLILEMNSMNSASWCFYQI